MIVVTVLILGTRVTEVSLVTVVTVVTVMTVVTDVKEVTRKSLHFLLQIKISGKNVFDKIYCDKKS